MYQALSFAGFARLTPRERMLRALAGGAMATYGLEVGAPEGQLGFIPMRGLGLTPLDAPLAPVTATATLYTAPAPIPTAEPTRQSLTVATLAPAPAPAPAPIPMNLIAPAPAPALAPREYDYSTLRPGKEVEGEVNQFTQYDEDSEAPTFNPDVVSVEEGRRKRIKQPSTGAEAVIQKAVARTRDYTPWVLGGLAIAGVAFYVGRKR